ncbi:MAG: FkbM family methyltransferase, partial [Phycisphaerae bacterium]
GVAGARGLCFEPVPATYEHLLDHLHLNRLIPRVTPYNCALGNTVGEIRFTTDSDTTNHAVLEPERETQRTITVAVHRLDEILPELTQPSVWKIDVEGFEQQVIEGAGALLASPNLWAVIMEFNGSGGYYGNSELTLHGHMVRHGFKPCLYHPFERRLEPVVAENQKSNNVVYVKDQAAVAARIKDARRFTVLGQSF